MKAARARDCGLPNLDAEIAFWKKAFGLDDWTITARYVEELKSRCRPILERRSVRYHHKLRCFVCSALAFDDLEV